MFLPDPTIPVALYDALVDSENDYGDEVSAYLNKNGKQINLSVTSLQKPMQQLILLQRHYSDIVIDPLKDRWHSLMGNIIHWVLEKHASKNPRYITEYRLGWDFEVNGVLVHIHGKSDIYDREESSIEDWKLTSATNMLYPKTAYEKQLNILKFLYVKNGYEVKALKNIYLFPHLDKTKFNNPLYPQRNAKTVIVAAEKLKAIRSYIEERIASYLSEKDKKDKDLTPCTDEERWVRGNVFKAFQRKKSGKKNELQDFSSRASHQAETKEQLVELLVADSLNPDDIKIQEFKGEANLCKFCAAAPFCHQRIKEQLETTNQPTMEYETERRSGFTGRRKRK